MIRWREPVAMVIAMCLAGPLSSQEPTYSEAPELRALVEQGVLPPVEDRLPEEPLVVTPYEESGEYGGSWARMMKGTKKLAPE